MQKVEVFSEKPNGFVAKVEVAACYITVHDKILFLLRSDGKAEGKTWGVPGGKIEEGETPLDAVIRELKEETEICVQKENVFYLTSLYIRKKTDYVFHMFHIPLEDYPEIQLNHEHIDAKWFTEKDLFSFPLVLGGIEQYWHYKNIVYG